MTTNPALFLPLRQQVVRGNDERSVLGILPAQSIHDHQRLYGLAETDLVRDEVPNVRIPEDPAHSCNLVRQWISGNSESANQPDIKRRDTSTQCLNAIHEPEVLVHQLPPVRQISERELASKGDIANGSARLDIRKCLGEQVSPPFRFHHQLGRQPQLEHGSEFGAPEPSQAGSPEGINVAGVQQVDEVVFAQFAVPGTDQ